MLGLLLPLLIVAAPPAIKIEKSQTTVVHNGTTIVLLADGSIKITGPAVDLTLPGGIDDGDDPLPEVVSPFQKAYSEDPAPLAQKQSAVVQLLKVWETALKDLPTAQSTGAYHDNLKVMSKPIGPVLMDLRKEIGKDFVKVVTDDVPMTAELRSQLKPIILSVIMNLKGIK